MGKKVCILIMMLLIGATILPVAGSMSVNISPILGPGVVDQQQPNTS